MENYAGEDHDLVILLNDVCFFVYSVQVIKRRQDPGTVPAVSSEVVVGRVFAEHQLL